VLLHRHRARGDADRELDGARSAPARRARHQGIAEGFFDVVTGKDRKHRALAHARAMKKRRRKSIVSNDIAAGRADGKGSAVALPDAGAPLWARHPRVFWT
jgi:hypothetical protein